MTGLNKITEKILAEARADAAALLEETQRTCDDILAEADKQSKAACLVQEAEAQKAAEALIARAKSGAAIQNRQIVMEARSAAVDRAFAEAYRDILHLPEEKYVELLARLLAEALLTELANEAEAVALEGPDEVTVPDRFEVILNQTDRDKIGARVIAGLERIVIGKVDRETLAKVVLSRKTAAIDGGLILVCGDIECNCSLETLFVSLRSRLEGTVADLLFA